MRSAAILLTLALAAGGCGPADPAGGVAREPAPAPADGTPHRVVAFTCAAVDIYRVLGLLDRVIAVEEDCPAPGTEHAVKIRNDDHPGQVHIVHVEAIMAMRPDLVIVKADLREVFEGRGMRMIYSPPVLDMDTMPQFVTEIAAAMGVPERGAAALDKMRRIQAEVAAVTAPLRRVRVYFENNGVGRTAGNRTVTDAMITLAGGENIIRIAGVPADDLRPAQRLNPEAVIAADPEVIVLGTFAPPTEEVLARPGWDRISAVRSGRVHRVPEEKRYGTFGSPRCVEACRDMYLPWIHPELPKVEWKEGR
ncbi:MAG: hypothetical protein HMLKMBBP_00023 [Planctomycetes bacterium]|nr:hypothetical protein [Planctomycetota bacterium]